MTTDEGVLYFWNNVLSQVIESRLLMYLLMQESQKVNSQGLVELCKLIDNSIDECDINDPEPAYDFEEQTGSYLQSLKEKAEADALNEGPDIKDCENGFNSDMLEILVLLRHVQKAVDESYSK